MKAAGRTSERKLLETTLNRLSSFESSSLERLTRLEENLRLLRQDLVGDGQPGRIQLIETDVTQLRAEYHRQRGIFAAISFIVSGAVALFSRLLYR